MSFPVSPINGETATVNGISYVYNSTKQSWKRQTLVNLTLGGNVTASYFSGSGANIGGNIYADALYTTNGLYWAGNSVAFSSGGSGSNYTASPTAPVSPLVKDQWYDTTTDILYEYIDDGSDTFWLDIGSPYFYTNSALAGTTLTVSGTSTLNGNVIAAAGTVSTSTTTGALVVTGGAGISGSAFIQSAFISATANVGGNLITSYINTVSDTNANLIIDPDGSGWTVVSATTPVWMSNVFYNAGNNQATSTSTGAVQLTGGMSITTGNLYIGGSGGTAVVATGNMLPSANLLYDLGSNTSWWNIFYGKSVQAQYADLAENYQADADYASGTVVVFGGTAEVTTTTISHDTRVAGVISTDPAYLMNAGGDGIAVAMTGRVPCQVRGPVSKGTVLVTSETPGVAEAIDYNLYRPGAVLGKSLAEIANNSIQTIEVVVGRF